ncbi:hypothetical protein [Ensifer sp. LCM 4579]|uniref:hypothetical protein n=1 Tax=Ensifer sp. LCM 4579 TaxID=1848292 RepID=UPI0008DB1C46|nr:hypothetical protein [Ensifer sp. LCM 4579]OHV81962.1 hypothetical protein LCM4579_19450 [Ensifer sp. LCM 4579]
MIRTLIAGSVFALAASAGHAADLIADYAPAAAQCDTLAASSLTVGQDLAFLRSEVVSRMDHAIAVAEDPRWIASTRPTFVWASETKVACGKAYGYLQSGWADGDYLAKCDCFHARMLRFMN